MWLKQLTTGTFSTINKKIDRVEFLRRNKKSLSILAAIWCILVIGGFLLLNIVSKEQTDRYLIATSAAVDQLAEESGSILLEAEVLGLSRKVAEFTDEHEALLTAILDHQNKVMAHSDPEQLNRIFEPILAEKRIKNAGDVLISTGHLPDGKAAIVFMRSITYSGVRIGRVVTAMPRSKIQAIATRLRIYKLLILIISTLVVGAGTAMVYRKKRQPPEAETIVSVMDGAEIGPYRLKEKIARGGMAELYKADYLRQDGFRRAMAVKRVLPHLAENQDFINMFIREARLAALLQHPNIVQIFDFGKIQNAYFIAMEYIDGLNLGQIMARLKSGLPINMALFLGIKISIGLDYSHTRKDDESGEPLGIVHRDISPQNILVSYQGEVKISDFGISKANTEPSLTRAGVIKGKLSYLSPEQALGQVVDHQCDIYALGLILYEILTASRVYQFKSDIDAIRTIPEMTITPLNHVRSDIPGGLNDIVMKCLEKNKASRYANALQLHDDLVKLKARMQISYDASDLSNFMRMTFEHA